MSPTYSPIRDEELSKRFGLGVNLYRRAPGHMDLGYADPWNGEHSIDLAVPMYEQVKAMETLASGVTGSRLAPRVNPRMAKAGWVLAHELGHLNSVAHDNEDQANTWATAHYDSVLKMLGLKAPLRRQLYRLARSQSLV